MTLPFIRLPRHTEEGREGEGHRRGAGRLQIMIWNRSGQPCRLPPPGLPRMTREEDGDDMPGSIPRRVGAQKITILQHSLGSTILSLLITS